MLAAKPYSERTLTLVPPLSLSELPATLMVTWHSALDSTPTRRYTQYTWDTCSPHSTDYR